VHQAFEVALRGIAINACGRIEARGQALIGEIQVTVGGEDQIVDAAEAFAVALLE